MTSFHVEQNIVKSRCSTACVKVSVRQQKTVDIAHSTCIRTTTGIRLSMEHAYDAACRHSSLVFIWRSPN